MSSSPAILIAAAIHAMETAEAAQTPEDLRSAGEAFTAFMRVLAFTPAEVQRQAMDSHDARGFPPPTLTDAFEAYREAGQRVFDRYCHLASA